MDTPRIERYLAKAQECERLAALSPEALEAELDKHEPWRVSRYELARDDDPLYAAAADDDGRAQSESA